MEQENRLADQENYHHNSREELFVKLKKKTTKKKTTTLSTSKLLKSLEDSPCSSRTIRRHLNNKRLSIRKEFIVQDFTMKHIKKRLDYARQYQTLSTKVVFSDVKKFNLDCPEGFQKYWHVKKENYSTRYSGGGFLMTWGGLSRFQENLSYNFSTVNKKQQIVKMLNELSLTQEGRRLCGEGCFFSKLMLLSTMYQ